ncbi:MAG TPA: extracellular solute-binding protein [Tepidisphaeraceae bacterium]|nr:extracellular solute-binding protein [Tepidisphaeraceae bacterium]
MPSARSLTLLVALFITIHARGVDLRVDRIPEPFDQSMPAVAKRATLAAFLDKYPDIHVERFAMPIVSGGNAMDSGPLMAIAAGVSPHVIYVNFRKSSTYIAQNFLEPLDVLLARVQSADERARQWDAHERWLADPSPDEVAQACEQLLSRAVKPVWPVIYREKDDVPGTEKHVWALPTNTLIMALVYRKDLFLEAGLNPDHAPRNWDEFLDYARRLTVPEKSQYGFGIYSVQPAWTAFTFLTSNGARAVERDTSGQWRAVYDTREAAEAVRFLWQLMRQPFERDGKEISTCTLAAPTALKIYWARGQMGMQFAYLNEELMGDINPQLVGMAPVPLSPRGTRGSEVNCEMLGVFSESSPEQKLAAMKWIWFYTSDQAKRIRTRLYVDNGYGTFVDPDLLRKFGYERVLAQQPKGWAEVFDTAMKAGVPEPYGRNTDAIWRYMSRPMNDALELPISSMTREQSVESIQNLLRQSTDEVNRKLLGIIPPQTMRMRRIVALCVILFVAFAFGFGMAHVWRYFGRMARNANPGGAKRRVVGGYLLLAPALILVAAWQYLPLGGGAAISMTDFQLTQSSHWVGLDNFAAALFDDSFWAAFARTFYFVLLVIGLGFWPPILLAILLQEVPTTPAKYIYRTVYYLPAVVSGVIVMFLWQQLYMPGERGVLNQILLSLNHLGPVSATGLKLVLLILWLSLIYVLLSLPKKLDEMAMSMKLTLSLAGVAFLGALMISIAKLGSGIVGPFHLEPLRWTQSPELAMVCVVIPMIWAGAGHASILYLAALKNVPEEIYEAAEIDGATPWHKIFYIVLPRLKYLIVIQFIAAVIGAFKGGTDYILALTGGGPNESTTVLALEIFFRTFLDLKFGIGAAMAWILGAVLIGFTAYQLKMLSRAEFRTSG